MGWIVFHAYAITGNASCLKWHLNSKAGSSTEQRYQQQHSPHHWQSPLVLIWRAAWQWGLDCVVGKALCLHLPALPAEAVVIGGEWCSESECFNSWSVLDCLPGPNVVFCASHQTTTEQTVIWKQITVHHATTDAYSSIIITCIHERKPQCD